jgi:glycosyltransferase involved in cell wall biosynthesis
MSELFTLEGESSGNAEPLVSVVLPVYNGARTIARAVKSILAQTYRNFEFVIINDGSTDDTSRILETFEDPRIRILNQENRGLVPSLNTGILSSRGAYIARMDADDEALPERLEKQVTFLESHVDVAVVGSAVIVIYEDGTKRLRKRPLDTTAIVRNIVRICPFCHSSVMIRKSVFDRVGLYDASKDGSKKLMVEDYDLWVRMLEANYELANLPEVLVLYYRDSLSILRRRTFRSRAKQQILSRIEAIKRLQLGPVAYVNIFPVVVLSALNYYGIKLDRVFNVLSSQKEEDVRREVFECSESTSQLR